MLSYLISFFRFLRVVICIIILNIARAIRSCCGCSCSQQQLNKSRESTLLHKKDDDASPSPDQQDDDENNTFRVCVIGGGIAGMSSAYGLARIQQQQNNSNTNDQKKKKIEVTVLEPRPLLGGNAKTHDWSDAGFDGVRTGLSVLAWPASLFHNYETMLRDLGQEVEVVTPTFMVSKDGNEMHWAHTKKGSDLSSSVNGWAKADMQKWDRAINVARRINHVSSLLGLFLTALLIELPSFLFYTFFACVLGSKTAKKKLRQDATDKSVFDRLDDTRKSMYTFSILNPLNIIAAHTWMVTCFGVSQKFWDTVVIPVYSSSFLTTAFHELPATILVPLDDIISVGHEDPCKPLHTWRQSSKDVFDAIAKFVTSEKANKNNRILTGAVVEHVIPHQYADKTNKFIPQGKNLVRWSSSSSTTNEEYFDAVIFACPGPEVRKLIHCSNTVAQSRHRPGILGTLLDEIVGGVTYEDTRDDNYVTGKIHDDEEVIPHSQSSKTKTPSQQPELHKTFFDRNFSNYVRIFEGTTTQMCNVFSLGTWVPAALRHAHKKGETYLPLFVSYDGPRNAQVRQRPGCSPLPASSPSVDDSRLNHPAPDSNRVRGEVDNSLAHPRLNLVNLARMWSLRFMQGESGLYYCSNYTTPGNGHDLSLLSGMSVASRIGKEVFDSNENENDTEENVSAAVHHPMLQYLGSRRVNYETKKMKSQVMSGNIYATSLHAQSDFDLLRGMMGL